MPKARSKPEDSLAEFRREFARQKQAATLEALFRSARLLNEAALARLRERTQNPRIRARHTELLPHLDFEGTRLTTLAERLGVSKQAAGELVDELEGMGMVERVPDPADGRAKLVRFSRRGREGLLEGLALLRELEAELSAKIGAPKWKAFAAGVRAILDALDEPDAEPGKAE
jgi:DNA-binding MarR family transcriptional regulator